MHQFDERHTAFKGFSSFYFQVIGPRLENQELERKAKFRKLYWSGVFSVFWILIVVWGARHFRLSGEHSVGLLFFGLIFASYNASVTWSEIRASTRYSIIGGFCRFKNWSFHQDWSFMGGKKDKYGLNDFVALGLVPAFEKGSIEGHISGETETTHFEFFRATLTKSNRIKYDPYPLALSYTGQFITLGFERKFQGRTIVCPDMGIFNRRSKRNMKRVRLVDPMFEKMFEVYGTDQVEARYLLSPDFMHRLVELEHSFKGNIIRFAFVDNQLRIAIKTPMRLGVGSMHKPLNDPKRTQNVLNVLAAIYDVIDGVTKPLEPITVNPHSSAA